MGKVVYGVIPISGGVDGRDTVSVKDKVVSGDFLLVHLQGWIRRVNV